MLRKILQDFDIEQIANSGQCFRIHEVSPSVWLVKAFGSKLCITKIDKNEYLFDCTEKEYESVWFDYFDLGTDYSVYKKIIQQTQDAYLIKAINYGSGIRILKQDLWETIITFIISQQNNISRIKNIMERICLPFDGIFPSPTLLKDYTEVDFKILGLGYRARYIVDIVEAVLNGKFDLNYLAKLQTQDALQYLQKFSGIGLKIANCIALFSLHKIDAFPVDVWIKRIVETRYAKAFPVERYAAFVGIVQQYMFFYERSLKHNLSI